MPIPAKSSSTLTSPSFPRSRASRKKAASQLIIESAGISSLHLQNLTPDSGCSSESQNMRGGENHGAQCQIEEMGIDKSANEDIELHVVAHGSANEGSSLLREQICLCQPDPKIPRPRNGELTAFPQVVVVGEYSFW